MKSVVSSAFSIFLFLVGMYAVAGGPSCKDNYTTCTEGGCGMIILSLNCDMWCETYGHPKQIKCKHPRELGDEDSEPIDQSP